jgi:xanthine dehydrogenase accessory factor
VKEILPDVERWEQNGESVVVATVVATRRSAPDGSSFAVSSSGACGPSPGCVESDIREGAGGLRERLAQLVTYGISDDQAWTVGLPAAEIDVSSSAAAPEPLAPRRGPCGAVTVSKGDARKPSCSRAARRAATAGGPELADVRGRRNRLLEARVFAEWYGPPPRLLVYGAIDTAEALRRLRGSSAGRRSVADAREKFATRSASRRRTSCSSAGPTRCSPGPSDAHTAIVVLTRRQFDEPALIGALDGGVLRRRARIEAEPGAPAGAPPRGGGRGGRSRQDQWSVRPRRRRRDTGRDRALDPRGDPRGSRRP